MTRRSTPERLDQARRAGIVQRLIGDGELPERVDESVSAWEAETESYGLDREGVRWERG